MLPDLPWETPSEKWEYISSAKCHKPAATTIINGGKPSPAGSPVQFGGPQARLITNIETAAQDKLPAKKTGFSRRKIQSLNNAIGFWQLENSTNRKCNKGDVRCLHRKYNQQWVQEQTGLAAKMLQDLVRVKESAQRCGQEEPPIKHQLSCLGSTLALRTSWTFTKRSKSHSDYWHHLLGLGMFFIFSRFYRFFLLDETLHSAFSF